MKYELQLLDDLIKDNFNSNAEELRVIENIKKNCFSIKSEESTKLYVRKHQYELNQKKEIDLINSKSDAVLHFLELVFGQYLDENLPISDIGKHKFVLKYSEIIEAHFPTIKSKINSSLYNVITPLFDINFIKSYSIYHSKFYSEFWDNWKNDCSTLIGINEFETAFTKFLIANNFNSLFLHDYILRSVINQLIDEVNPFVQEEIIYNNYQIYSNIPVRKGHLFRIDYPELKPLLVDWFKDELKRCKKKKLNYIPNQTNILKPDSIKIETTMSVGQMAYLFKLLMENGIISKKIQANVLHFVADNFTTKKSESISYSSLNNKYYNIDDSTKSHVKSLLFNMFNSI